MTIRYVLTQERVRPALAIMVDDDIIARYQITKPYDKRYVNTITLSSGKTENPLEVVTRFIDSRMPQQQRLLTAELQNYSDRSIVDRKITERTLNMSTCMNNIINLPGFTYVEMKAWVYANIPVPSDLMETYVQDPEGTWTRERTFIKSEYQDLAVLSLFMKIITPMVIHYLSSIRDQYEDALYMKFIWDNNKLFNKFSAFKRLEEFIEVTVGEKGPNEGITFNKSIASGNLGTWIIGKIITTQLIKSTLLLASGSDHMVAHIHKTIGALLRPKTGTGGINGKSINGGEDGTGVFDDTRVRAPLSVSDLVILVHTTESEYLDRLLADVIDIKATHKMISATANHPIIIDKIHYNILALALQDIVNPIILPNVDRAGIHRLMCYAFMILVKKHPMIALLVASTPEIDDDNLVVEIEPDHVLGLTMKSRADLKEYSNILTSKNEHVVTKAIRALFKEYGGYSIQYIGDRSLLDGLNPKCMEYFDNDRLKLPMDLYTLYTDALLQAGDLLEGRKVHPDVPQ